MPTLGSFDYAVIRVVPRVEREEFMNAGVILFARTRRFLGVRIELNAARLAAFAPGLEIEQVEQELALITLIGRGDPEGGPLSALSLSERFHWLVAPRSTVIQISPVHSGLCDDPNVMLDHLVNTLVLWPPGGDEPLL